MVDLRAKSSLDQRGFNKGVDGMDKKVGTFEKRLGGLKGVIAGAFSLGIAARVGRQAVAMASEITDLATQLDLTTDEFQALELAALDAGVAKEKVRGSITKLGVALGQAKQGMGSYVDLFETMGIASEDFIDMNVPEALEAIADVAANAEEGSAELSAAWQILGTRSGPALKEVLLNISKEGLQSMIDKSKEAGDVIDADLLKRMDALEDKLQRTGRKIKQWALEAAGSFQDATVEVATFWGAFAGGADAVEAVAQVDALRAAAEGVTDAAEAERAARAESSRIAAAARADAEHMTEIEKLRVELGKEGANILEEELSKTDLLAAKQAELVALKKELTDASDTAGTAFDEAEGAGEIISVIRKAEKDRLEKLIEITKKEREVNKLKRDQLKTQEKITADIEKEMKKLDEVGRKAAEKLEDVDVSVAGQTESDRLARIGGIVGTQVSPEARVAERQVEIMKRQNEILEAMPDNIAVQLAAQMGLA